MARSPTCILVSPTTPELRYGRIVTGASPTTSSRWRWLDIVAAVWAGCSVARFGFLLLVPGQIAASDFAHYYVAGRLLLEKMNPYTGSLATSYARFGLVFDGNPLSITPPNPPLFIWLFAPLTMLPVTVAYAVWQVVQLGCLFVILVLTRRLLGDRLSPRGWRFVWAVTVAATPMYWHFFLGQTQLLLTALLLAAFVWQRSGRDTAAVLAVLAAGLLKIFPLALLPWFVWRGAGPWRARWGRACLAMGVGAVVVWATHGAWWVDFFQKQGAVVAENLVGRTYNVSVPSLVANVGVAFTSAPEARQLWASIGVVSGLLVIAGAYGLCWRDRGARELEFAFLCAAVLAGSPTTWGHYFVCLIFPLALVAARVKENPLPGRVVCCGLILAFLNNLARGDFLLRPEEGGGRLWARMLINYVPLMGLLGLVLFLAWELVHSHDKEPRDAA